MKKNKEKKFRFCLSYGHDVDMPSLIEVKAKNSQEAYFRAVETYKEMFNGLNKEFSLEQIFEKKGIGEYLPYFLEINSLKEINSFLEINSFKLSLTSNLNLKT